MGKFAKHDAPTRVGSPISTTTDYPTTTTHEGAPAFARDAKSDLFLLAASNMVGEDTFYEGASERDARFRDLIHQVTAEDPEWGARFVPYLRDTLQMRSASVVVAAEYVAARGPHGRAVVNAALQRADEPAEMLAYWHALHGRKLPAAVKRGVADAVTRLYTERAALRYDGTDRPWRFADVIELVHPHPVAPWQSSLFRYLLDKRHHGVADADDRMGTSDRAPLPTIAADLALRRMPEENRRALLSYDPMAFLETAGWSWERLAGWLPGGMDAEAWKAAIPRMGYMALLRNLRNFDQAGLTDADAGEVARRLADPEEVARSRQFPIRFLSAYREVASMRWAYPLERALEASLANVPRLRGRTLVLVDCSASMWSPLSGRSKRQRYEVAAVFGFALARRAESADLVLFGSGSTPVEYQVPLLRAVEALPNMGGTDTFGALMRHYRAHDRVVVLTDEQAHPTTFGRTYGRGGMNDVEASAVPLIYTFNLAGYSPSMLPSNVSGRFTFGGGLTDQAFKLLEVLESRRDGEWPHLAA